MLLLNHAVFCRSTFEAPIEPKMVLGGYPYNTTDYIKDTTALLITLPVDNNQNMSSKILQWEVEFLRIVRPLFLQAFHRGTSTKATATAASPEYLLVMLHYTG